MAEFPTYEQMAKNVADKALDEFLYDGKSIREWMKIIAEQEPCDDEYIKVPKKALKYRTAGMVAYNAEWLKNNFDIERAVICGAQQPCDDAISREATLKPYKGLNDEDTISVWLIRKNIEQQPSVNPQPKTVHCKDCKWWKDSDGMYRRGGHAESLCPINRIGVLEGHGYCYMFEPQKRSDKE